MLLLNRNILMNQKKTLDVTLGCFWSSDRTEYALNRNILMNQKKTLYVTLGCFWSSDRTEYAPTSTKVGLPPSRIARRRRPAGAAVQLSHAPPPCRLLMDRTQWFVQRVLCAFTFFFLFFTSVFFGPGGDKYSVWWRSCIHNITRFFSPCLYFIVCVSMNARRNMLLFFIGLIQSRFF